MLASLTRKHMHALQQTNRRKRDNDEIDDETPAVDKKAPSSPGTGASHDHVVTPCDPLTGSVDLSDEVRWSCDVM